MVTEAARPDHSHEELRANPQPVVTFLPEQASALIPLFPGRVVPYDSDH